ncbi:FAD-binding protein [Cryobacterium lactosi]|uniref:FAD-binding protein n=1 Tax=Cryobacterium lactosi TaxID=1259202 RepID=A0A4R9BRU8_9MICO|nr:D-arabinono-1,4-lactone oxidase [Cryobacterium lactosi]TFD88602.1 FAD-binding protein [Cryobacterium lactosi]
MSTTSGAARQHSSPAGRNWSGTYDYRALRLVEPTSIAELQQLVASTERIRGLGTRHSFNSLPDTTGALVHLGALVGEPVIDPVAMTVMVDAATPYGVAAEFLQRHGYALHNTGSLPHISVAGAISTGTHGSGDVHRNLSSAVAALQLVTAHGELRTVRRGDPGFDGMVVGLGAFGVITRVSLDIQPTFDIRQDAFVDLPWETVLSDFDAVMGAAYSVSLMTHWAASSVDQLWLKTRVVNGEPAEVDAAHLGAAAAPVSLFDTESSNMTPFGGVVGPWSERLYHFRLDATPSLGDEIQSEYLVPRERIVEALTALRGIGERLDGPLAVSEIRTMAGDDLWLSPAYGRDSVGVHFTWRNEPDAVDAVLPDIEAILLPLGARPHWGKHHHVSPADLAPLYPRLAEWGALVTAWDPTGKFGNTLIDELRARALGAVRRLS